MKGRLAPYILLSLALLPLGGCALTGPTCESYLEMDDTAKRKAADRQQDERVVRRAIGEVL